MSLGELCAATVAFADSVSEEAAAALGLAAAASDPHAAKEAEADGEGAGGGEAGAEARKSKLKSKSEAEELAALAGDVLEMVKSLTDEVYGELAACKDDTVELPAPLHLTARSRRAADTEASGGGGQPAISYR
jgi:hypothetical protein